MSPQLEARVRRLEQLVRDMLRSIAELFGRVKRLEDQAKNAGGGGGGGGSVPGIFYADHLNIAAHSTGTGASIYQSWDGSFVSSTATIRNIMPDPTINTKRQILGKNPDGSYTILTQSCTDQ